MFALSIDLMMVAEFGFTVAHRKNIFGTMLKKV